MPPSSRIRAINDVVNEFRAPTRQDERELPLRFSKLIVSTARFKVRLFNRIARLLYFVFYQLNKVSRARRCVPCIKKVATASVMRNLNLYWMTLASMASIFDGSV